MVPFKKAIIEFGEIMRSSSASPLDKLYKLQYLSIMEYFRENNFGEIALMTDENLQILVYIAIQSKVPDLVS